ncbi:MAG: WXG100 family type VII secretion target [Lachnospiraceae bacterium]|nr:WXG100 family type VII secretion target [Lachnospiraceae bacterium]
MALGLTQTGFLSSLTVTPEVMLQKANSVQKYIRLMRQDFSNLENTVNKTQSYWIGEAGDAHREFYQSKKEEIETIFARLTEDVTDLQTMAGVYSQTEKEVTELAQDLPADVII